MNLPKISIITPSYNQGAFIEETIRSVVSQDYPALEYIIIDGGSTDCTREIIEKYSDSITYWESEPDRGQTHAINKGWARATGDVVAWLNSDDMYCPGALRAVGAAYAEEPGAVIAGNVIHFDDKSEWLKHQPGLLNGVSTFWLPTSEFQQPGIFFPRLLMDAIGDLDENLYFCMDLDLLCRVQQHQPKVILLDRPVAKYRWHPDSKSSRAQNVWLVEQDVVWRRHGHTAGARQSQEHDQSISKLILVRALRCLCLWRVLEFWEYTRIARQLKLVPLIIITGVKLAIQRMIGRWRTKVPHR
jgi:glycosyltransferase involved in cell wall biosynthesis